jgi:hypothetical protein
MYCRKMQQSLARRTLTVMLVATWFTAIATCILAIFAVVTAWYARKAFREQSEEVRTLKTQLKDQEDLNAKQTPVLELQTRELQESIEERRRDREESERRQAIHVAAWVLVEQEDEGGRHEVDLDDLSEFDSATMRVYEVVQNASDEPIWDVIIKPPILVEKHTGSDELKFIDAEDEIISIGPHETRRSEITRMTLPFNRFPLRLEFRDNAGRDWSRDDRGRLHPGRISEPTFASIDEMARAKSANRESGNKKP